MTTLPYQDLLQLVRQLPQSIQLRLAEDLLKTLRTHTPKKAANVPGQPLAPVIGLTKEELKALAGSVVVPDRQQQIAALLELNRDQQLSAKNEAELDELLAEVDRIALLKAHASYTLQHAINHEVGR
jgi:hypothetical protein